MSSTRLEIAWYREKFKMLAGIDSVVYQIALSTLNAGEERHLSAIAEAFADEKGKLDLAEEQYDQKGKRSAVSDHRCTTMEEIRLKTIFASDHVSSAFNDPWYVALVESMRT